MINVNFHIKNHYYDIDVKLDQKAAGITYNALEISTEGNTVTIFATKSQLKDIADAIYRALEEDKS